VLQIEDLLGCSNHTVVDSLELSDHMEQINAIRTDLLEHSNHAIKDSSEFSNHMEQE
jgi:tRNA G37 N-methylase TrmD